MSIRCVDGRLFRSCPFPDDPDFEVDAGKCPSMDREIAGSDDQTKCLFCENGIEITNFVLRSSSGAVICQNCASTAQIIVAEKIGQIMGGGKRTTIIKLLSKSSKTIAGIGVGDKDKDLVF